MFDVTSAASFDHIEEWMARVRRALCELPSFVPTRFSYLNRPLALSSRQANPTNRRLCAQLLIGNKCDQSATDRQVSVEAAVAFARRHDMIFCAVRLVY